MKTDTENKVYGEKQGLKSTLRKSGVRNEVIESSDTNTVNSEYFLGLNCKNEMSGDELIGYFCTCCTPGSLCKEPEVEEPVLQKSGKSPLELRFS